jgi:xanthine dehydrogenase accessory factor
MNPRTALLDIHRLIVELSDRGQPFALALVLKTEGSTPRKAGTKAVVEADGVIHGTIGGGRAEAETQRRAAQALESGRPEVFDIALDGSAVEGGKPICGGNMRILVDPRAARHREAFAAAAVLQKRRERGVLLTTLRRESEWQVSVQCLAERAVGAGLEFPARAAVVGALQREEAAHVMREPNASGQPEEVLIEPLVPKPVVLIVGGGHIGQAVAAQASLVGFDIVVIDDRGEFTAAALFPEGSDRRCGLIGPEVASFPWTADTYVVIVTRGHEHDAAALAASINQRAAYIGMIGSRRKVAMLREEFVGSGRATAAEFDRVYAPIGLDIGSVTVPEIAASIVGQLIAVRRTGRAPRMRVE